MDTFIGKGVPRLCGVGNEGSVIENPVNWACVKHANRINVDSSNTFFMGLIFKDFECPE